MIPGSNIESLLNQAAALALRTVRDDARRYLSSSASRLVNLEPLAKAIGLQLAEIQRVIQAQIDGRNTDTMFTRLRTSRQAVIETFNAIKYVAMVDSNLPLPNAFEYNTQRDERVRITHEELEGTTLPPNDLWWKIYYPPNDWNCRCFVRGIYGAYSAHKPKTKYKPSADFNRNLGVDFIGNVE